MQCSCAWRNPLQQGQAEAKSVALDSRVTILLSADEPGPIQQAAQDVANDFEKVLGSKPRIVSREGDAGPTTILVGERAKLPEAVRPEGLTAPESFSIAVKKIGGGEGRPATAVVLAGADMRGTIYALYQFSQEYLGVDPMYYWTDHEPLQRTRIEIPASLNEDFSRAGLSSIAASFSTMKIY